MAVTATRSSSPAAPPGPNQTITARRIRFVSETAPGAKVRRAFKQPRRMFAVEEVIEPADLPTNKPWPEPTDHLLVVFVPRGAAGDWSRNAEAWMAPPADQADAVQPVVLERE